MAVGSVSTVKSGGYVLEDLGALALLKGSEPVREAIHAIEAHFPAGSSDASVDHVHKTLGLSSSAGSLEHKVFQTEARTECIPVAEKHR